MPKLEDVCGKISVRNEKKEIIGQEIYPANFVFPKIMVKKKDGIIEYYRVDDISGGWKTLMNLAGVESLQLKDFRTYFNHLLKTKYNFTSKEAGAYIGNNERWRTNFITLPNMSQPSEKRFKGFLSKRSWEGHEVKLLPTCYQQGMMGWGVNIINTIISI